MRFRRERVSCACLLMALLGCGAPAPMPASSVQSGSATSASGAQPELPEGACGGWSALSLGEPVMLLEGRLAITRLGYIEGSPRPTHIVPPDPESAEETRLVLHNGAARFVVLARELHALAGRDPLAAIREMLGPGYSSLALEGAATPAFVAIPRELAPGEEDGVLLLELFTITSDDRVQRASFFVSAGAAADGGCRRVALRLARTVRPGPRRVEPLAGDRVLQPSSLGITLPEGYDVTVTATPSFGAYRVRPLLPLGAAPAGLGVLAGDDVGLPAAEAAVEVPGRLFGNSVTWLERADAGGVRRETLVRHPAGNVLLHVFVRAGERGTMEELVNIAESLTATPATPLLPACSSAPAPPAPPAPDDPDVALLARASSYSPYDGTWAQPFVDEGRAYRRLLTSLSADTAFLHLALAAETVEGRLWGLTGLRVVDPSSFERVVCAVRRELPPTARGLSPCGPAEVDVAETIESSRGDAIRGEAFWSSQQWELALDQGTPDLRGGALPRDLWYTRPDAFQLARDAALLSGDGFRPPLVAGASSPPPLAQGDPGALADPYLIEANGGCAVRRDGRLACWGYGWPREADEHAPDAVLLPDVLRFASDIEGRLGAGCMLDRQGTRVCWSGISPAARRREEQCGGPPAPREAIAMRQHDDGPWERLLTTRQLCGVRPNGELHCFVHDVVADLPTWATLDRDDMRFAVPIEGHVAGAVWHLGRAVVWTRDGAIHAFDRDQPPRRIAHLPGLAGVSADFGSTYFAWLDDGRVMAHGVADERPWWRHHAGPLEEGWREIPELRGARVVVSSLHGCALFAGGRVACFGSAGGFSTPSEMWQQVPLTDVPALRGARALGLAPWRTCGWMPEGRLVCMGTDGANGMPGVDPNARPAVLDVRRLLQRARALR